MEFPPPPRGNISMSRREKKEMAQKIVKGGKIADGIRKMENAYHADHELPRAEEELERKFEEIEKTNEPAYKQNEKKPSEKPKSLFARLIAFLKRIFLP